MCSWECEKLFQELLGGNTAVEHSCLQRSDSIRGTEMSPLNYGTVTKQTLPLGSELLWLELQFVSFPSVEFSCDCRLREPFSATFYF
jgi:hypothetical protein